MPSASASGPLKKATNLSINKELLGQARELKINLSATLEQALEKEVKKHKETQWLADNKVALQKCNELTEKHGLFADKHRVF
ncbi:MAG: type II toxin-antitoxin system CcdA family antitoxin [Algicola sp.]|nr:type II toxin-antitoxin system CcdA family antitoxin [Algicola sp.]